MEKGKHPYIKMSALALFYVYLHIEQKSFATST